MSKTLNAAQYDSNKAGRGIRKIVGKPLVLPTVKPSPEVVAQLRKEAAERQDIAAANLRLSLINSGIIVPAKA